MIPFATGSRSARPTSGPLPAARIVLLGASNLALTFRWAKAAARAAAGPGAAEVLAAAGLGRAYGVPSRILLREQPAILQSEIWERLAIAHQQQALPVYALLTDLGNDLAYGVSAAAFTTTIADCLARLTNVGARIAVTPFPLESVARLSPWRFALARSVLFPGHPLSQPELLAEARKFNRALQELCARNSCAVTEMPAESFGWDHIHLRWRVRRTAWERVMTAWRDPAAGMVTTVDLSPQATAWS